MSGKRSQLRRLSGQEGGLAPAPGKLLDSFRFNLSEFYSNLAAWISFALPEAGRSVAVSR
jgi:hypothetical protein